MSMFILTAIQCLYIYIEYIVQFCVPIFYHSKIFTIKTMLSKHGHSLNDLTEDSANVKKDANKREPLIHQPVPLPPFLLPQKLDKPPLEEPNLGEPTEHEEKNHLTVKQAELRRQKEEARPSTSSQKLVGVKGLLRLHKS